MKKIKIILVLLISTSAYGQLKDSLVIKTNAFKSFNLDNSININSLDLKVIKSSKNNLLFSSYNETSKLNDNYLLENDNYIYNSTSLLFENQFRGHKIDSFNPNGANSVGSALIFSIVNSILK